MSKLWSVALFNVTVGWSAFKIEVFPDHTACMDPGKIVGERGGGGSRPIRHKFFQSST